MPNYTKLFSTIVTSTIWQEPDRTRIVWITMLALSDKNGEIHASIPGLARIAGVPTEACEEAINAFLSPDKYSRTADHEGRRIAKIDGGWELLNFEKYRLLASTADTLAKNATRQKRFRERNAKVTESDASVTPNNAGVTANTVKAEAEAEAETDSKAEAKEDDDNAWAKSLADPEKPWIDVDAQFKLASKWYREKGKELTRPAFVSWLDKVKKPLVITPAPKATTAALDPDGWKAWCDAKGYPYMEYGYARGYMKEEFNAEKRR